MPNKDEVALKLAQVHYDLEPGMLQIFRLQRSKRAEADAREPIKLLEVNEETIPTGIMPLGFPPYPDRGIPYHCIIVEITPEEFEKLQAKKLQLPHGWTIGPLLPRPARNGRKK